MLFIVRHETNGKRLMVFTRFLESRIDNLPADAIGSRLKFIPEPTAVSNGSLWKNRSRSRLRLFCRWTFLRPTETLIQRLTVEPLKGRDAHARINEYLINRFRPDHNGFVLSKRG